MQLFDKLSNRNVFRIYGATLGLGLAYGMAISLLSLHLSDRGFTKDAIGTLAAWFAAGIVSLSLPMGRLIERFTAKVTLVCSLLGYATTVALFPFLVSYTQIAVVRLLDGACSVGVWVSTETMLLSLAGRRHKASVTSIYAIVVAVGYLLGPLFARTLVTFAPIWVGFVVAGGFAALSGTYVALRVDRQPARVNAEEESERDDEESCIVDVRVDVSFSTILWKIKTSCYATFAYGYFQASVVLFLPLYLMEQKGVSRDQTIVIPAFFAAGMLLCSNVGGKWGDRRGHLGVMRILAAIGTVTILGFVLLGSFKAMAGAVFVAGATLATISPLSLALQGVVVSSALYARANSVYNAFYALGMLLGPPISSLIFVRFGGASMLYHLAGLWAGFVVFSAAFFRDDPHARGGRLVEVATPDSTT